MNLKLKIESKPFSENGFGERLFSFAVIDLDKSESYPQNFVCMLPVDVVTKGRTQSVFHKVFGDNSVEQAKALLIDALASEGNIKVKTEIERRLKLLMHTATPLVRCSMCGKTFDPGWTRRFRRKFCAECMARKYGNAH